MKKIMGILIICVNYTVMMAGLHLLVEGRLFLGTFLFLISLHFALTSILTLANMHCDKRLLQVMKTDNVSPIKRPPPPPPPAPAGRAR